MVGRRDTTLHHHVRRLSGYYLMEFLSGFPHVPDQFIPAAASSRAVAVLALWPVSYRPRINRS
jgi:hypothetical protein